MGTTLRDQTVILNMVFHLPGSTRSDGTAKVKSEANPNWTKVIKDLFQSEDYDACARIQRETKKWLNKRKVPSGLEGYYVLPVATLPEAFEFLDQQDAKLKAKVNDFVASYEKIVAKAEEQLKDLFDPKRYPPAEYFRTGIWNERELVELGIPEPAKIGEAVYAAEKAKADARIAEEEQAVLYAMREQFRALVGHLAEKLEPSPDGSKKVLKDAALDNLMEWMDLFGRRNVLGDAEMARLVEWSKRVLKGVDADTVRSSDRARTLLAGAMGKVREKLDALLVDKPKRRIRFDD